MLKKLFGILKKDNDKNEEIKQNEEPIIENNTGETEAEKVEAERLAKVEAEKQEAERLAKIETEKQEAERLAKIETEKQEEKRIARVEAEKQSISSDTENTQKKEKKGFFSKIREGLAKTKDNFTAQLNNILNLYTKIDDDFLDEIEEILITSDMGVELTMDIIDYIKEEVKVNKIEDPNEIKGIIKKYLVNMLSNTIGVEDIDGIQKIIMVVGVNGVGKTTSIGKMSHRLKCNGKSVVVAAGDTFRAAAVEQLKEWCNRADVEIIASEQGSDPGSVIYDAIQAARARKSDVLICDTAGRLHNKVNLMNELTKIFKIVDKEYGHAQREVLLVVDATTGQNGLIQAKMFSESCKIDGIILTKLDGTAKGGIVFPIVKELNVPIKYIAVGEKIDDLQVFDAEMFVDAIFE
ncbi:signal recognition particle-docking protein FtsY [Sedimentibacter sp. zth1]|uniref:signal recognition particle-docking protein FtsY n=1 Tax=Sedimentibacter sp. zth1 TaxID=2816908 RepID=UPI001A90D587|nr:signal recognition particle-docking protein FtsY [Sedimentibacter sp. zth1]QSX06592.1 signal recognition particle-docking protein FtsY [Sedimentibacter sp. zth1]